MPRNIANLDEIDAFVGIFTARAQTDRVRDWLTARLRTYLARSYPGTATVVDRSEMSRLFGANVPAWAERGYATGTLEQIVFTSWLADAIRSIIDFLESSEGASVSLARLSVEQASEKAEEWHARLHTKKVVEDDPSGVQSILVVDELRWVKLTTPAALRYEGALMQHCVGEGSYDGPVETGLTTIFSLRDADNQPQLTVEMQLFTVTQVQGRTNRPMRGRHRVALALLLNHLDLTVDNFMDRRGIAESGILFRNNKFVAIDDIADETIDLDGGRRALYVSTVMSSHQGVCGCYYLMNAHDDVAATLMVRKGMLLSLESNIYLTEASAAEDLPILIARCSSVVPLVAGELLEGYGWHVWTVGQSLQVGRLGEDPSVHLVGELNGYRLYRRHRRIRDFVQASFIALDRADRMVLSFSANYRGGSTAPKVSAVVERGEWPPVVPLLIELQPALRLSSFREFRDLFYRGGYIDHYGRWMPVEQFERTATVIVVPERGRWYYSRGRAILIVAETIMAILTVSGLRSFVVHRPLWPNVEWEEHGFRDEIMTLLKMSSLPVRNQDDFLRIGIYSDEEHLETIEMFSRLLLEEVYINEDGHVTGRGGGPSHIAHALRRYIGCHVHREENKNFVKDLLAGRDAHLRCSEHSVSGFDMTYTYADAAGYRRWHGLADDDPLPLVVERQTVFKSCR